MIPLILFVALGLIILILFEYRARHQEASSDDPAHPQAAAQDDTGCCGQHLVCERETLLQTNAEVVYYDDEELDCLAGKPADEYSETEQDEVRQVFRTLQEKDVPGWCRSMQLRNIQLPSDVKEEALLIVRERRKL